MQIDFWCDQTLRFRNFTNFKIDKTPALFGCVGTMKTKKYYKYSRHKILFLELEQLNDHAHLTSGLLLAVLVYEQTYRYGVSRAISKFSWHQYPVRQISDWTEFRWSAVLHPHVGRQNESFGSSFLPNDELIAFHTVWK